MQKQQRRAALVAQLDKLRSLAGALGRDGAVVADHADGAALDVQVAADSVGIELGLEVEEIGRVGQARENFAHVIGIFRVVGDQAQQVLDGVQRLCVSFFGLHLQPIIPRQRADNLACDAHAIGIVFRQVFGGSGGLRMHLGAAQFFIAGHFAGGGFQQRRPGEKQLGLAAHHHHVVRQPWLIRAARRGRAVHHSDLRQAHG